MRYSCTHLAISNCCARQLQTGKHTYHPCYVLWDAQTLCQKNTPTTHVIFSGMSRPWHYSGLSGHGHAQVHLALPNPCLKGLSLVSDNPGGKKMKNFCDNWVGWAKPKLW